MQIDEKRVAEIFAGLKSTPEFVSAIEWAIKEGVGSKKFVRALAQCLRDGINAGKLDVDRYWQLILDAEAGKFDKRWAEVFAVVKKAMAAKKPARKVARKRGKR